MQNFRPMSIRAERRRKSEIAASENIAAVHSASDVLAGIHASYERFSAGLKRISDDFPSLGHWRGYSIRAGRVLELR